MSIVAGSPSGDVGLADGTGTNALLRFVFGIAVDTGSGDMYVSELTNCVVRKITSSFVVSVLVGSPTGQTGFSDGTGTNVLFARLRGIHLSTYIYVADEFNSRIRQVSTSGVTTTLAGSSSSGSQDGTGTNAMFSNPYFMVMTASQELVVTDRGGNRLRKVDSSGKE